MVENRHGDVVVLLRWASREGRSRAATGSGCRGLLGGAAEPHRYHRVRGSAGPSLNALTTPGKRTNGKAELGKSNRNSSKQDKYPRKRKSVREKTYRLFSPGCCVTRWEAQPRPAQSPTCASVLTAGNYPQPFPLRTHMGRKSN